MNARNITQVVRFQSSRRRLLTLVVAVYLAASVASLPILFDSTTNSANIIPVLAGDPECGECG
ncbi:hypothetical protein KFU94_36270 [Chloroflexi bacterium TSY]|nr:hypothetical protein [Chloroflexi bacterium TSY]